MSEIVKVLDFKGENLVYNGCLRHREWADYINTSTTIVSGQLQMDRWYAYFSGTPFTATLIYQQSTAPGAHYASKSMRLTADSAGSGNLGWYQRFSPNDLERLKGETITLSCKMKSNHPEARLTLWDGVTVPAGDLHPGDANWHDMEFTYDFPDTATFFDFIPRITGDTGGNVSVTGGDYIVVSDLKLEIGESKTEFFPENFESERIRINAYSQIIGMTYNGFAEISTRIAVTIPYITKMIKDPIPTIFNETRVRELGDFISSGVFMTAPVTSKESMWTLLTGFTGLTVGHVVHSRGAGGDQPGFIFLNGEM